MQTSYSLSDEDRERVQAWLDEVVYPALEKKKPKFRWVAIFGGGKAPYSGAIGGNVSYVFTPTSIGVVVEAVEAHSGMKLDLTDYKMW